MVGSNTEHEPLSVPQDTRNELESLTQDEIVLRVIELEVELNEFQESSKELEQALEEELQELEQSNASLREAVEASTEQLQVSKEMVTKLNQEISDLNEAMITKTQEYETQITALKQSLVTVEIVNDDMEENDRMLSNKLELANQFNNELLEKLAIIESDLQREKQINSKKQLHITNYEIETEEQKKKIQLLQKKIKFYENNEVESLFLSMKDILNAGPPPATIASLTRGSGMKKSDSLKKLHELTANSKNMSKKARNLKDSVYTSQMKSSPTTKLSKHTSNAALRPDVLDKENVEPIQMCKSNQLSSTGKISSAEGPLLRMKLLEVNRALQFQTSRQALEAVNGSPMFEKSNNVKSPDVQEVKKRHRKTNIFETFRALGLTTSN